MNLQLGFADFDSNDIEIKNGQPISKTTSNNSQNINKKRERRVKGRERNTIKDVRSEKVEKFLKSINSNDKMRNIGSMSDIDSDDDDIETTLNFPPNPQLQSKTKTQPLEQDIKYNPQFLSNNNQSQPVQREMQNNDYEIDDNTGDNSVSNQDYNLLNGTSGTLLHEYYQNYVPNNNSITNTQEVSGQKDMLIEKLNYMIHLLEEQQEEKTGHVTEELILYSFLGVFIIFVIDSFARASKYAR